MISLNATLEIDHAKIDRILGSDLEESVIEGMEPVARKARGLLINHQDPAPNERGRKDLIDSIEQETTQEGNRTIGRVGPDPQADDVGTFLELGHEAVYWGRPSEERVQAYPFLRPAFFSSLAEIVNRTAQAMRRKIR